MTHKRDVQAQYRTDIDPVPAAHHFLTRPQLGPAIIFYRGVIAGRLPPDRRGLHGVEVIHQTCVPSTQSVACATQLSGTDDTLDARGRFDNHDTNPKKLHDYIIVY